MIINLLVNDIVYLFFDDGKPLQVHCFDCVLSQECIGGFMFRQRLQNVEKKKNKKLDCA